jgi:hypothetical protein
LWGARVVHHTGSEKELNDRLAVKEKKMNRNVGESGSSQADLIGVVILLGTLLGVALVAALATEGQKKALQLREGSEDDEEEKQRLEREEEERKRKDDDWWQDDDDD